MTKTKNKAKTNILDYLKEKRKQDFLKLQQGIKQNRSFKDLNSRSLQMFSGKRVK